MKDNQYTDEQGILYTALSKAGIPYDTDFKIITDMCSQHGHVIVLCPDCRIRDTRILVEVKGGIHNRSGVRRWDDTREKWLAMNRWTVMSFSNSLVRNALSIVIGEIAREIDDPQEPRFI